MAAIILRDQLSAVLSKILYTNVAFEPFHTPQAPSVAHNCEITSRIESGLLRTIWFEAGERDDGDGMTYPERSVMCRRRGLVGEYDEDDGAEDVK